MNSLCGKMKIETVGVLLIALGASLFAEGKLSKCQQEGIRPSGGRFQLMDWDPPKCRPDGSFEPVQCLAMNGYCFCVDTNGKHVKGSGRRRGKGKPKCGNKEILNQALALKKGLNQPLAVLRPEANLHKLVEEEVLKKPMAVRRPEAYNVPDLVE